MTPTIDLDLRKKRSPPKQGSFLTISGIPVAPRAFRPRSIWYGVAKSEYGSAAVKIFLEMNNNKKRW